MAEYELPYHREVIRMDIPEKNVMFYGSINAPQPSGGNRFLVEDALRKYPLHPNISGRRVCLIVEDATREVPLNDILEASAAQFQSAAEIFVLIATGTHDGNNDGNKEIVGSIENAARNYRWPLKRITVHDCHAGPFLFAGQTETIKNHVYVNSEIAEAEVFVTFSDMKNHYFAGYSNALKNFLPGICAYETIEFNHALTMKAQATFGYHPLHPDEKRRDNPLARDMWEGFQLIIKDRPVYVLATVTQKNRILWTAIGLLNQVVPEGIGIVDRLMSLNLTRADRLIVSCGGYPNDESLYSAQRALELTRNAVRRDGEILFLAACANGIGPKNAITNFFQPLTQPIDTILKSEHQRYRMYAHKPFKFAQLIRNCSAIHMVSRLPESQIRSIHVHPVNDAQEVIDRWLQARPDCSFNILTQGNKVAVHV